MPKQKETQFSPQEIHPAFPSQQEFAEEYDKEVAQDAAAAEQSYSSIQISKELPSQKQFAKEFNAVDTKIAVRSAERGRKGKGRRAIAALATGAALTAAAVGLTADKEQAPQPTDTYTVEPGDTAWDIAEQAHDNMGSPDADPRKLSNEISEQVNNDGTPGMQPGDIVELPASADTNPEKPGIQLDPPTE